VIDIHAHILPGLDDGPPDLETAARLAQALVSQGVTDVICTPHYLIGVYQPTRATVLAALEALQARAPDLKLHLGAEVYIDDQQSVRRVTSGEALTLGDGGRYVLIEHPLSGLPLYAEDAVFELRAHGITPIVAHPERNEDVIRSRKSVRRMVELGALLQINAGSVLGEFGKDVGRTARSLVEDGLVHFLASDCHDLVERPPRLRDALDRMRDGWRIGGADAMAHNNPLAILDGVAVTP
jgi:protein-tyrosine phosphatase